jgi:flagella basal body P-ring formation protein FlgA
MKKLFQTMLNISPAMVALLFISSFLLSTKLSASGNNYDIESLVHDHAERQVLSYAKGRGWVNFDYEVEPWVPSGLINTCNQGLNVSPSSRSDRQWGRIPYEVTCQEPTWNLRARADVSLIVPVVTARRNISRDEPLGNSTLKLSKVDLSRVYTDFVTDIRHVRGKRARRTIRQDQVLSMNQVIAPYLVEENDRVLIQVMVGGIEASMIGIALESGSKGQGIRVKNTSSTRIITAWISGKGIVDTKF